jgi:DNA-binding NarL/FixJ family response regulator
MVNLVRGDADKKTPFLDLLSPREKEILQLLAKGFIV